MMEKFLAEEAPHFLYTLLHLELPPYLDRLRIPVVTTASKLQAEEENRNLLEIFIDEHCDKRLGIKDITVKEFYAKFYEWVTANEKHNWPKERVLKELPNDHRSVPGTGNKRCVNGLAWKPTEGAMK
jgi:hypothetical protein